MSTYDTTRDLLYLGVVLPARIRSVVEPIPVLASPPTGGGAVVAFGFRRQG
jgi:hypothetical protein